jgi:hypothetical protein
MTKTRRGALKIFTGWEANKDAIIARPLYIVASLIWR